MRVTVFGSGYVGLVTAACLAETGNHVICIDIDEKRINDLNNGKIPIYEPGLEEIVFKAQASGLLEFTTDHNRAVNHGLFQFIAVGTPPDEDGSADLTYILEVANTIGSCLTDVNERKIIINKSTVPVGTCEKVTSAVEGRLSSRSLDISFDVVSNPEFLKEGNAISDFKKPDRIIFGVNNSRPIELLHSLYEPFNRSNDRIIIMDQRSSEFTKYAANAMLATKISFMNELANMAELVGVDIELVRKGMGSDNRIGYHFIYPGCGYGGSCFPKDVKALINIGQEVGFEADIIKSVESVNIKQKKLIFEKIYSHFNENINNRTVALWGLSFKPNTNDMREAPSKNLIELLLEKGCKIRAYDPIANYEARRCYGMEENLTICDNAMSTLKGADVLSIVTEWREFNSPDFVKVKQLLKEPTIFDGRNLYDPKLMKKLGFRYYAIGRGDSIKKV